MKHSITFLDNTTILVFSTGQTVIVDESLKGWETMETIPGSGHLGFKLKDRTVGLWADGSVEWFQHGDLDRADGPASIWANGTKEWYQRGIRHRDDGPAIIRPSGIKRWFQHGVRWQHGQQIPEQAEQEK